MNEDAMETMAQKWQAKHSIPGRRFDITIMLARILVQRGSLETGRDGLGYGNVH